MVRSDLWRFDLVMLRTGWRKLETLQENKELILMLRVLYLISQCMCLRLSVCPCHCLHGRDLRCRHHTTGVEWLFSTYFTIKRRISCLGTATKASRNVCLLQFSFFLESQHATVPFFSEFIRFIQTTHANKTHTDLCPVNSPVSVNSKIYSWLSKLTSSSPSAYVPSELSQVMRMCWNVYEWQDWLVEYMGLNEAEFISLLTSVKRLTWVSVIWLILVDRKPGKEDLNIYYQVVTFIRGLILPKQ